MTNTDAALRLALAAMAPRQRAAFRHRVTILGEVWHKCEPDVARAWAALAEVVAEVDAAEQARAAADQPAETMRHAR